METLRLLFPQFGYAAQKEEVYFRMLGPGAAMKDHSSRSVPLRLLFSSFVFQPSAVAGLSGTSALFQARVASTDCTPSGLNFLGGGPSRVFLPCHGRQKDKERNSRLSLFLTKSGSHESVSPQKQAASAAST